jgi:hypothetical protein
MENNLWLAETFANLAICTALLCDRRCNRFRNVSRLQIASVALLFLHNMQLNFGDSARYHYSWQIYDFANVMWQTFIVGDIILRCPRIAGRFVLMAYLLCLDVTYQEYAIADEGRRELANQIFWGRQWLSAFSDWLFAFAIYTDSIGNPDKENAPCLTTWLKDRFTSWRMAR